MIGGALFAVVGLLFLLAAIQLFTATLYQSLFGVLPNTALGLLALAVFAASLLAGLTGARLGTRRSIALTGAALAVPVVVTTAVRQEWLTLVLAAIAVAAGTQWLALVHAARPADRGSPLGVALPIALVLDLALRAAAGTIPAFALPLPLAVPLALVAALLFLAGGIAFTAETPGWAAPSSRDALGLVALPPLLLVAATGGLNGAQLALAGGLGLDGGPSTAIGLLVAGCGLGAGAVLLARGVPARPAAAAALGGGALLLWPHLPYLSTAAGAACAAGLLAAATILPGGPGPVAASPWRPALALGLGWILFVAGTFAHYAFFGPLEPLWLLTALVVAAVLLSAPAAPPHWGGARAAVVAGLAVLVPAGALALVPAPRPVDHPPATFRVMTFNLHQGFDAGDIAALDRQADLILHEAPDVLIVQEVVRGWLIDEGHDVLGHLAARLGMDYVFAPNIGDLYGNAILSRYPISEVRRVRFAKEPGLRYQPRGAIVARVAGVLVIGTHLDENRDASAVRMEQVRDLLRAWDGARVALIACDCNALPEARELQLITDAGFGDLALQAGGGGPTFPADAPSERIDYLFGIGLTPAQAHPVASGASDHRAVVLNVTRSAP